MGDTARRSDPNAGRSKLSWLGLIVKDKDLSALAKCVATLFATSYMHSDRGLAAWPSLQTVADDLDYQVRAVRAAVSELTSVGYLTREERTGATSVYRMGSASSINPTVVPKIKVEIASDPGTIMPPPPRQNPAAPPAPQCRLTPGNKHREINTGKIAPGNPSPDGDLFAGRGAEPKRGVNGKAPKPDLPAALLPAFEAFWNLYPRRTDKRAARIAYAAAAKRGADLAAVEAGAGRYAAERRDEPARFTKHPATWLNRESWADETPVDPRAPEVRRQVVVQQKLGPMTQFLMEKRHAKHGNHGSNGFSDPAEPGDVDRHRLDFERSGDGQSWGAGSSGESVDGRSEGRAERSAGGIAAGLVADLARRAG